MAGLCRTGVTISHFFLEEKLKEGDRAIDATCGNGNDTLFLAHLVGDSGLVFGFDIQEKAINNTLEKLTAADLSQRVKLIQAGHQLMRQYINEPVKGVIFNLGYLPGGDQQVITESHTTIEAITGALELLQPGGLVIIVLYPGHAGGQQEAAAVLDFAEQLDKSKWDVVQFKHLNRTEGSPQVLIIEDKR
ncbi:MAG: class I SAM-dependent methyltransferase [Bacillota bacterium]|nr:class I SAM-dependent methyltransferase [Bacillota bacterium]